MLKSTLVATFPLETFSLKGLCNSIIFPSSSGSIVPLKIYDTDPLAGVTVYSTEKRVGKDGSVWEKKLVEWFYFDIDGKIQAFDQYAQDIKPVE